MSFPTLFIIKTFFKCQLFCGYFFFLLGCGVKDIQKGHSHQLYVCYFSIKGVTDLHSCPLWPYSPERERERRTGRTSLCLPSGQRETEKAFFAGCSCDVQWQHPLTMQNNWSFYIRVLGLIFGVLCSWIPSISFYYTFISQSFYIHHLRILWKWNILKVIFLKEYSSVFSQVTSSPHVCGIWLITTDDNFTTFTCTKKRTKIHMIQNTLLIKANC